MLPYAHVYSVVSVSAAFQSTDSLSQPGGEKEGGVGTVGGQSLFAWEELLRPMARLDRGNIRIQQEVTCRVTHSSLFSSGKRERGRSREKEGASRVEVNGPGSSLILAVWKRAAECDRICLTTENKTEQDRRRDTEKKNGGRTEGHRREERKEGGGVGPVGVLGSFVFYCDLLSTKDLVGKVFHGGWATALPRSYHSRLTAAGTKWTIWWVCERERDCNVCMQNHCLYGTFGVCLLLHPLCFSVF